MHRLKRCEYNKDEDNIPNAINDKNQAVLEKEAHKILWDFKIKINHPIPARRPNPVIIKKKRKEKENQANSRLCRTDKTLR